ncbi:hypothetical protein D1007_07862 [Hordeum vulgare]|nr:hypothetical protein D1007_07862 [Hordeum vulgare]
MDADDFQAMLESMLRLDCLSDDDGATAPQDAPAQPAAAADEDHAKIKQSAAEWMELLVGEMASAGSMDDARSCATKVLEAFGGAVCSRAVHVLADKDREVEKVRRQNTILKRAVVLQHRQHVEDEEKGRDSGSCRARSPGTGSRSGSSRPTILYCMSVFNVDYWESIISNIF